MTIIGENRKWGKMVGNDCRSLDNTNWKKQMHALFNLYQISIIYKFRNVAKYLYRISNFSYFILIGDDSTGVSLTCSVRENSVCKVH